MDLQKIAQALYTLDSTTDDITRFKAVCAIREEGKDVVCEENGLFYATGTYTPPKTAQEVFERARMYLNDV